MSLLYKRPNSPNFYVTRTRESTRTSNRKLAEEYARKALTEAWRNDSLGEEVHTWDSLAEEWLDRKDGRPSLGQDTMVIERFSELLKRRDVSALEDVTADLVAYYAKVQKAQSSAATANRHLTTIRAMLRRAAAKGWINRVPTIEPYQITRTEVRPLTIEQFDQIAANLPKWVADMATIAVQTGMRMSNVVGLQWEWISLSVDVIVVPAVHTKTARTYTVPLSTTAKKIISVKMPSNLSSAPFTGSVFIDPSTGEQPEKRAVRYWWTKACEAAGFPNTRWHDLRHTWASMHVRNGTPDRHLAKMGGWASTRMLEVYAHLNTSHLAEYADNVK